MKKVLASALLSFLFTSTALAQSVVVTGNGINRDAAINDAKRNAVEKVVGAYISSQTVVVSPYVLKDEIYSKAYGFIKDIEILTENPGTVYEVKARIEVDSNPNSQLANKLEVLRVLNNPRISVVINHNNSEGKKIRYINLCEAIIFDKLREMGFTNLIDKAKIWQKKNEGRGADESIISDSLTPSKTIEGDVDEVIITDTDVVDVKKGTSAKENGGYNSLGGDSGFSSGSATAQKEKLPPLPDDGSMDYKLYLPNSDTDFFIFGNLEFNTRSLQMPKYDDLMKQELSNFDTGFLKTTATLDIKILKSDTLEQIGTYSIFGTSMHSDMDVAEREAIKNVANQAAIKISESFKQKGASIESGFTVSSIMNQGKVSKFLEDIKKSSGVRNVKLRAYAEGRAEIEVVGDTKTFELFKYLQQHSSFRVMMVNKSDSKLEITVA